MLLGTAHFLRSLPFASSPLRFRASTASLSPRSSTFSTNSALFSARPPGPSAHPSARLGLVLAGRELPGPLAIGRGVGVQTVDVHLRRQAAGSRSGAQVRRESVGLHDRHHPIAAKA